MRCLDNKRHDCLLGTKTYPTLQYQHILIRIKLKNLFKMLRRKEKRMVILGNSRKINIFKF